MVKKRGRKPKNKIIINHNPCFENNTNKDVIIKIENVIDKNIINNDNTIIWTCLFCITLFFLIPN